MAEDLRTVISPGGHHGRPDLAETNAMPPSAPVEYVFIPLPLDFEGGTLEAAGAESLADGKFLAYHPAALLRDESKKRDAWHDFQAVQAKLRELSAAEP